MLRLPYSCPYTNSPGWIVSVPSVCRPRPATVTQTAQRHRGEGRWPSGEMRKTMINAVKAGQPSRGDAQADTWAQ
jgi:hypothetical protein